MNINQKGSTGERELAGLFNTWFNWDCERKLGQAREGGCDIEWPPFAFEVKRREVLDVPTWWYQVWTAAKHLDEAQPLESIYGRYYTDVDPGVEGWIPVLAYRQNRKSWSFCVPAHFIKLEKGYITLTEPIFKNWIREHFV